MVVIYFLMMVEIVVEGIRVMLFFLFFILVDVIEILILKGRE